MNSNNISPNHSKEKRFVNDGSRIRVDKSLLVIKENTFMIIISDLKLKRKSNYRNTLCHFPPKSNDFTDFCEGENYNGQQKKFWKIILKILFNFN